MLVLTMIAKIKVKVKTFNHSLIGTTIACTRKEIDNGKVGRHIEDLIEATGVRFNRNGGVDLPDYGVEVKSRCSYADTNITISTMTTNYVLQTPYELSFAAEKLQQVRVVDYDFDEILQQAIITNDQVHDWSSPDLQYYFKKAYERGQRALSSNIKPGKWWEIKKSENKCIFQISNKDWISLVNRSNSTLFDIFSR